MSRRGAMFRLNLSRKSPIIGPVPRSIDLTTVLEEKINGLKQQLFTMAGIVEEMVANSIKALVDRNAALAAQIIEADEDRVNRLEIETEDAAINLMARTNPRRRTCARLPWSSLLTTTLKDSETMRSTSPRQPSSLSPGHSQTVGRHPEDGRHGHRDAQDSLDAFTRNDGELARAVCARDTVVDDLNRKVKEELSAYMAEDPKTIERALKLMMISLNLERIADLATNIAEDVIYMQKARSSSTAKANHKIPNIESSDSGR